MARLWLGYIVRNDTNTASGTIVVIRGCRRAGARIGARAKATARATDGSGAMVKAGARSETEG